MLGRSVLLTTLVWFWTVFLGFVCLAGAQRSQNILSQMHDRRHDPTESDDSLRWDHDIGYLGKRAVALLDFSRPAMRRQETTAVRLALEAQRHGFSPYFVLDGVLHNPLLRAVAAEIPETRLGGQKSCLRPDGAFACSHLLGDDERRVIMPHAHNFGPATRALLDLLRSSAWVNFLSRVFGIHGLVPDPHLIGGGIHSTRSRGFLKLHADFNFNTVINMHRRVNVFVFLNMDWDDAFGGHLEIWNKNMTRCGARINPRFGRVVAFRSTDFSYHGFPGPLTSPPNRTRRSLALYYYTAARPKWECRGGNCNIKQSTDWNVHVDCSQCTGPCCAQSCDDGTARGDLGGDRRNLSW
eukprot:TRINITY_DN8378_c0_g1_i1.p1 TRINITY_DN8378_c0_g1~~TRINITY_DN8378_c0_g1_i1.p1  ORF type:complete len:353 (-),score=22.82 TRINITY_DN8378_c0_g1_i1:103-1161(-)